MNVPFKISQQIKNQIYCDPADALVMSVGLFAKVFCTPLDFMVCSTFPENIENSIFVFVLCFC